MVAVFALASVACGPEVRFEDDAAPAPDPTEQAAARAAESPLTTSVLPVQTLAVGERVQGRGEFSADVYDGRTGDLSAVIFAAEPMLVIDAGAEPTEEAFEDVSVGGDSTRVLRRRVDAAELAAYADATGREYWLYDSAGWVCTATAADVWRVREEWGEPEDEELGDIVAPSRELVTVSLLPTEGECSGASFAAPAGGAQTLFAEVKAAAAPLSVRAMAAFLALPEYGEIQTDYLSGDWQPDVGGTPSAPRGHWTEYTDSGSSVTQYSDDSGRSLVRVAAWAGVGCGDFRGDLWAVWEQTPAGLSLRAVSQNGAGAAFFLERDGRLSYGTESQLHAASGNHWSQSFAPLEPWSCPC